MSEILFAKFNFSLVFDLKTGENTKILKKICQLLKFKTNRSCQLDTDSSDNLIRMTFFQPFNREYPALPTALSILQETLLPI